MVSAYPTVDIKTPRQATARPFNIEPPLNEPTIARPNTPSINSSGELKDNMIGKIKGKDTAKISAPNTPPNAETVKAAPNALAAFPC